MTLFPQGKNCGILNKITQMRGKGKLGAADGMEKKATEVVAALIWDGSRFLICQRHTV